MKTPELLPPATPCIAPWSIATRALKGFSSSACARPAFSVGRPAAQKNRPAKTSNFFPRLTRRCSAAIVPVCAASRWTRPRPAPRLIERLRAEVEKAPDGRLTDKELASLSIDPSTARRQFKRYYGMTFQAYHRARRMGLALREVRRGESVEEARNGSGFESESGFREAFTKIFGDPPTAAKRRDCLFAERLTTPLGTMLAVADDEGLRLLEFGDRRALERELPILRQRLGKSVVPGEHAHLAGDARTTVRLFRWEESRVRRPARSSWLRVSTARLGSLALDSSRRNAFLFLDGRAAR